MLLCFLEHLSKSLRLQQTFSNSMVPMIARPTKLTLKNATLIPNIF